MEVCTLTYRPTPPPSGNHRCVLCIYETFWFFVCSFVFLISLHATWSLAQRAGEGVLKLEPHFKKATAQSMDSASKVKAQGGEMAPGRGHQLCLSPVPTSSAGCWHIAGQPWAHPDLVGGAAPSSVLGDSFNTSLER